MDDFWKRCEETIGARETLSLRAKIDRREMTELEARTYMLTRSQKPVRERLVAAGVRLSEPPPGERITPIPRRSGMTAQELTHIENKVLHDNEVCQYLKDKGVSLVDLEELFQLAQLGAATRNRKALP